MGRKQPAKSKGLNDLLPVGGEADVVVIGSGPAGIAASRKGAAVILIERSPLSRRNVHTNSNLNVAVKYRGRRTATHSPPGWCVFLG